MTEPTTDEWPATEAGNVNRTLARLLTTNQAAEILNVSVKALEKWRVAGFGPKFICLSKSVRYTEEDLRAFIEESRHSKTSGKRTRKGLRGEPGEGVVSQEAKAA